MPFFRPDRDRRARDERARDEGARGWRARGWRARRRETFAEPDSAPHTDSDPAEKLDGRRPSRRALMGLVGGAVVVVGGGALTVLGPLGGARALFGGSEVSKGTRITGPTSRSTPPARPTPTPTSTPTPTPTPTPEETVTPTETPTPTPAPSPGAMPVGDLASGGFRWKQVYAEDFTTPATTGRVLSTYPGMGAYSSGSDTSGYGRYAPDRVLSVHDSVLDYHLHSEGGQLLSASVLPDDYAPHLHARVSVRYRATSTPGYKFVGMLWPSSDNWDDGEIDWPEGDLDAKARPASEVVGGKNPATGARTFLPSVQYFASTDQTAFHVATTEWTAGLVRFYWDGVLLASVTQGVPTKPMRVTLQAETWLNEGAPPATADGHLEIDWVTIYEQA